MLPSNYLGIIFERKTILDLPTAKIREIDYDLINEIWKLYESADLFLDFKNCMK